MDTNAPIRLAIISYLEAARRLNISRSSLYAFTSPRSKAYRPEYPKPVHLGKSTGFIEHEINELIRGLMQARGGMLGN